jgi:hypothetical protein
MGGRHRHVSSRLLRVASGKNSKHSGKVLSIFIFHLQVSIFHFLFRWQRLAQGQITNDKSSMENENAAEFLLQNF